MIELFEYIYKNRDSEKPLSKVLKEALSENDDIKLLSLRCNIIKEFEALEYELQLSDEELAVLKDLQSLLTQSNLDRQLKQLSHNITTAHLATIKSIYKFYKTSLNLQTKQEIEEIYKELPEEDIEFLNELWRMKT